MAQRILRPLEYGDLLDETFDLYKKNFLLCAGIAGVVNIPLYFLAFASGSIISSFALLFAYAFSFIVMAATTWAVSRSYLGYNATILESYKSIIRKIIPLFITMAISYLAVMGGFILLIVPGFMLLLSLSIMSQVVIIENTTYLKAIKRCWSLGKGQLSRIFTVGFITSIITVIASGILTWPIAFFAGAGSVMEGGPSGGVFGILYGLASGLAQALVTPIQVIAFVLLYYDIRVRKEGFDLELLATSLGESPAVVSTPSREKVDASGFDLKG